MIPGLTRHESEKIAPRPPFCGANLQGRDKEIADLLCRAYDVWQVSSMSANQHAREEAALETSIGNTAHHASLYFRVRIPSWPPHLLLRKLLRRVLLPFSARQLLFNEAALESLRGLSHRTNKQSFHLVALQKRVDELEHEVGDLHALIQKMAAGSQPESETAPPLALPAAPNAAEPKNGEPTWLEAVSCLTAELAKPTIAPVPLYFGAVCSEPNQTLPGAKPRVAFISPLPPARSGIADYSSEIIESLAAHYDLDLTTDDGYAPLPPFTAAPLSAWEKNLPARANTYRTVIYQLGNNNAFHTQSYLMLLRYAGITVLHDYLLTHFLVGLCTETAHLGFRLHDELAYEIGEQEADTIIRDLQTGKLTLGEFARSGVPMNRRVFTRSLGVILHNEWSYKQAQKERAGDNEFIALIPHLMPPVPLNQTEDDLRALRVKLGVPVDAFVFAPCGLVTESKRPIPILDAFKRLLIDRPDAFLVFVSGVSMPPGVDFETEIEKRGLTERVKVTGYVDMPTFNDYLRVADVCVTLRFPSQGESSGALLRMLVHGKPSIVTAIGSFDDFPDDTVHKLPTPDKTPDEVGEIYQAFKRLAIDKAYREKIAANGLSYILREHSPERCARLYARFIDEVMAHPVTRRKLLADWAGRDIARRAQAGEAYGDKLLADLETALHQAAPLALTSAAEAVPV